MTSIQFLGIRIGVDVCEGFHARKASEALLSRGTAPPIESFLISSIFQDRALPGKEALQRIGAFFYCAAIHAEDYIGLNCTKTTTVYRLSGNAKSYE